MSGDQDRRFRFALERDFVALKASYDEFKEEKFYPLRNEVEKFASQVRGMGTQVDYIKKHFNEIIANILDYGEWGAAMDELIKELFAQNAVLRDENAILKKHHAEWQQERAAFAQVSENLSRRLFRIELQNGLLKPEHVGLGAWNHYAIPTASQHALTQPFMGAPVLQGRESGLWVPIGVG